MSRIFPIFPRHFPFERASTDSLGQNDVHLKNSVRFQSFGCRVLVLDLLAKTASVSHFAELSDFLSRRHKTYWLLHRTCPASPVKQETLCRILEPCTKRPNRSGQGTGAFETSLQLRFEAWLLVMVAIVFLTLPRTFVQRLMSKTIDRFDAL
jgi:hypothetical protein